MKLRKSFIFLVLCISFLLLAACTEGTAKPSTNNNTSSDPKSNDSANVKRDIVIAVEGDAVTMLANTDVNYVNDVQIRNIYDALIMREPNGDFIPGLATDWRNVDELTWEFKLREGVKFHNGAPFNAEAVKYNIDYILNPNNNSFYLSRWEMMEEAIVVDEYTIQIKTKQPFPNLLLRIADDLLVMEPGHVEEVGFDVAARNPVGTGPYKFVEWSRDSFLKLESFDDYWQGKPEIETLTFRYIPEFGSRLSAFLSGDVDLFKNVPVDSTERIENDKDSNIASIASSRINYLALNNFHEGPLQDKRVRQAINYVVDVDELIATVLNGFGTKMTGPLSELNEGYTQTNDYGYNPDKAVELLKEAGYEPSELKLQLDTPSGRYPMDTQIAQAIAIQLERIGINVTVQVNEWGNHLAKIRQREMGDMFILGWGPALDAQGTIEALFTNTAPYSGFYTPEMEKEIQAAIPVFEPTARKAAFDEIQHLIVEEAAWVPLWQQADLYAVREGLFFEPRIDERYSVFNMKWNK